jgi:hypothetical protein
MGSALRHMSSAIRFRTMGAFVACLGATKATSACQLHAGISPSPRTTVRPPTKQHLSLPDLLEVLVELLSTGRSVLLLFGVQSLGLKRVLFRGSDSY